MTLLDKTSEDLSTMTGRPQAEVVLKPSTGCCVFLRGNSNRIILLIVCFWINMLAASTISCLGIMLVEFMEYYQVSKAAITWVAAIQMGSSIVVGPVVGILLKHYRNRSVGIVFALLSGSGYLLAALLNDLATLYLTFGLLAGMGPCCYYAIANSIIQHYFTKRRSLACAVILTAFSIGGFVWPPFCRWLISIYCWQGALLFIGGLHVQLVVAFMVMGLVEQKLRNQQRIKGTPADAQREMHMMAKDAAPLCNGHPAVSHQAGGKEEGGRGKQMHCNSCLLSWLSLTFMYSTGVCFGMILHAGVFVYTPVRSWQLGISKDRGALLVSIISAVGGFCRIPAGLLGDLWCVNRSLLLAASIGICGVLAFLSQFINSFAALTMFSAVYGSIIAVYLALQTVVLSDLAGMNHLSVAMGILLAGHGLSSLLLHPVAGELMDLTGSANTVFMAVGLVGVGGGVLVLIVAALKVFAMRAVSEVHHCHVDGIEGDGASEPLQ